MSDAIAWDLAERVAARVGRGDAGAPPWRYESLDSDFEELTAKAERLVEEETGLVSLAGPARARVTDRAGWVRANLASFRRLLAPLTERLAPKLAASPLAPASRIVAGAQMGVVLGWLSTRVLGQYDMLLTEDERPEDQDIVYYVGPNVVSLERRFAFPPRQFRLWLALHEVTHRAQFTAVPWMRDHFVSLVDRSIASLDTDPRRLLESLARAAAEIRAGSNPLEDGGLLAVLATPEARRVLAEVQALMSLLEGHGDVVMDRAGAAAIPSAPRFGQVLRERRRALRLPARVLTQLIGIDAKMRQYEEGERFVRAVEAHGGPELMGRVWESPAELPTLEEIREPQRWLERAGAR